jgi:selenide,water dikinase
VLARVVEGLVPTEPDPRLLVGIEWSDDAGVVRLDAERALVQTVDFFPPMVDDPWTFGFIAAVNALSDVWAMGGEPLTAMNVVGFPAGSMGEEVLRAVLAGGADAVRQAGALLVGGHSVKDAELKYGLSVTGIVHPDRIWRNGGARPGDALVLTKALGTGVLTTARKRDHIDDAVLAPAVASMCTLNRAARDVGMGFDVHAATDVTGFGLAGHAFGMARASRCRLQFDADALPLLPGAMAAAERGDLPGGTATNRAHLDPVVDVADVSAALASLVFDPQTSGGLLFAVPDGPSLIHALRAAGVPASIVGRAASGTPGVEIR